MGNICIGADIVDDESFMNNIVADDPNIKCRNVRRYSRRKKVRKGLRKSKSSPARNRPKSLTEDDCPKIFTESFMERKLTPEEISSFSIVEFVIRLKRNGMCYIIRIPDKDYRSRTVSDLSPETIKGLVKKKLSTNREPKIYLKGLLLCDENWAKILEFITSFVQSESEKEHLSRQNYILDNICFTVEFEREIN